jgi:hypothetical protein
VISMNRKVTFMLLWVIPVFFILSCSTSLSLADKSQIAELDDCLVDFSQKIKGHTLLQSPLPQDLDAEKLFSILDTYYQDKGCLKKVKVYPVRVYIEDDSYTLILCDKDSKFTLYKDLGKTTDFVDFPYYRQQKEVPCGVNK